MIFMDHLMPEMDGVETLRQIKELKTNRSKNAVIIILTANAVSRAREMFLEEGFADHEKVAQSENKLVDWKKGKALCMEDEEFYREMLQIFLDSTFAVELRHYYEESDFAKHIVAEGVRCDEKIQ